MPEAGNEERRNSFHGVPDRQISGSPNDINARESKKDQKPVPARQVVRICLLVQKHFAASIDHKLTIYAVTGYYKEWELHGRGILGACQCLVAIGYG
jgi:hypothetical protein